MATTKLDKPTVTTDTYSRLAAPFETLHGRVTIVLLGRRDLLEQVSSCRHIPLDVDPFITYLERTFGLRARTDVAQIPLPELNQRGES